jgi:hypothetical protein
MNGKKVVIGTAAAFCVVKPILVYGSVAYDAIHEKNDIVSNLENFNSKTIYNYNDIDLIGYYPEIKTYVEGFGKVVYFKTTKQAQKFVYKVKTKTDKILIFEGEFVWDEINNSTKQIYDYLCKDYERNYIKEPFVIPSMDVLYAFKLSHRYLKNSPHFLKTMKSIHDMRKEFTVNYEFSPSMKDWIKLREKETYDYGHPKLNQTKSNFFSNDGVNYIYDHDTIHEAVKHFDKPAYQFFKPNTNDVYTSKNLFNKQDEKVKLCAVLEESYVLALERSQIPFDFKSDPSKSFLMALEKICTSITSGWFREYAWENYYNVIKYYTEDSFDYVDKFKEALENGIIKPYKEPKND